jgi:hypothetical protein
VCEACDISGLEGICTFVDQGDDPDEECDAESPESCGLTGACDGFGACELHGALTPCAVAGCPEDLCDGNSHSHYPESCTRTCDGEGACGSCACVPALTACAAGAGNQCCEATCDANAGCGTAAGACDDVCGTSTLTTGLTCTGCGANGAAGTCGGGTVAVCDATASCQSATCGGVDYVCTYLDGSWAWRLGTACDDGDPCTHGDVCTATGCAGTLIECASTTCATRECNGTDTCTETFAEDTVSCGSMACPEDECDGLSFLDYPADCTRFCDGFGACGDCLCEPETTACVDGGGCCEASCSATGGCLTVPGSCGTGDTCGANELLLDQVCEGCGDPGAEGSCVPGGSYTCDEFAHDECEARSCGGTLYYCVEDPVAGWGWTADPACDDGDPCTHGDACSGGACEGTGYTCESTVCLARTCDGLGGCDETPEPPETVCGSSPCDPDFCAADVFHSYPDDCTRTCSGSDDTCEGCTCAATETPCTAGGCCAAACDDLAGCYTEAGACADVCEAAGLTTGLTCTGCGDPNAAGTCGGGTTSTCDAANACVIADCGGVSYECRRIDDSWQWTAVLCEAPQFCQDGVCVEDDPCAGVPDGCCDELCACAASTDECVYGETALNPHGVCKPAPTWPGCWSDDDCGGDAFCDGASVCGCGESCLFPDAQGACVVPLGGCCDFADDPDVCETGSSCRDLDADTCLADPIYPQCWTDADCGVVGIVCQNAVICTCLETCTPVFGTCVVASTGCVDNGGQCVGAMAPCPQGYHQDFSYTCGTAMQPKCCMPN